MCGGIIGPSRFVRLRQGQAALDTHSAAATAPLPRLPMLGYRIPMNDAKCLPARLSFVTKFAFTQENFLKRDDSVWENDVYSYRVVFQNDSLRILAAQESTSGSNAIDDLIYSNAIVLYQNN